MELRTGKDRLKYKSMNLLMPVKGGALILGYAGEAAEECRAASESGEMTGGASTFYAVKLGEKKMTLVAYDYIITKRMYMEQVGHDPPRTSV